MRLTLTMLAAIGFGLVGSVQVVTARPSTSGCDLPKDPQSVLEKNYPGRRLVSLSDLADDAKELFHKEHSDSCPGMVILDFYGDGKPTFALALTIKAQLKARLSSSSPTKLEWSGKPQQWKQQTAPHRWFGARNRGNTRMSTA